MPNESAFLIPGSLTGANQSILEGSLAAGNSTLNDRAESANQSMAAQSAPEQSDLIGFGHLWQDADGDYSSEDEENE